MFKMKNHKIMDLNEKKINSETKKARSDEKKDQSFQANIIKRT